VGFVQPVLPLWLGATAIKTANFNLLAQELFFFLILAHSVYKM